MSKWRKETNENLIKLLNSSDFKKIKVNKMESLERTFRIKGFSNLNTESMYR